jgi:hypothetical protein
MKATHQNSAASPYWFLTGPARAEDLRAGDPRNPDLVTHAKCMGSNATACGLVTTTWTKLWDIPFEAAPRSRRCPMCSTRVLFERRPTTSVS